MIQCPRCASFDSFPLWAFTSWGSPSQHFYLSISISSFLLGFKSYWSQVCTIFTFCLPQQECNLIHNHHRQVLSAVLYWHEKMYFMHISHMTWTKSFLRPLRPLYIIIMRPYECDKLLKTPIYVKGFGCVCVCEKWVNIVALF